LCGITDAKLAGKGDKPGSTYKSLLKRQVIGDVKLIHFEGNNHYLESNDFSIKLTEGNSATLKKALETNSFGWAKSLKDNNDYDDTINQLDALQAG